ncbi:hypothetical protein NDA16_005179 [Ustilago loliicola]|nr:hypothetical protein NDA16_005179 [Ustilago loliicola]
MPQINSSSKSGKQSKAAKAAKAILHPKSTIAAAKANHSRSSSVESATVSDASKTSKSPASSIKKTVSNASIASNAARPLSNPPSASASPAINTAGLPAAAQAPSSLGPPINNDLLSMKKQAIERTKPAQQLPLTAPASLPPAAAASSAPSPATFAAIPAAQSAPAKPVAASTSNIEATVSTSVAVPYTIDETPAESQVTNVPVEPSLSAQADKSPVVDPSVTAPTVTGSASGQQSVASAKADDAVSPKGSHDPKAEESHKFASEIAEVLASSAPASQQVIAEAAAAPTPVTPIMNKSPKMISSTEPTSTPAASNASASTSTETEPASAQDFAATVAAVVKVSSYTPPELTRIQHNTFVSRPSDPSRAGIRKLDASLLPSPLRPIDRQRGVVRSPSHVIIFGWMDAPIRLVAKYAQPYTVLFPDATVLIQLSDGKSYLARENVRREQLQHIIAEISSSPSDAAEKELKPVQTKDVGDSTVTLIDHSEARSSSSSDDGNEAANVGGFVIHSFSDGGAGNLALFLDEMARRKGANPRVHSLIMDSSPGKSNPRTGSFAFTMHLANRPRLRAIVRFFVYLGLYLLKIWTKITGQPQRGELMRKRLNSLRSWSWVTASHTPKPQQVEKKPDADYPPRMYLYTKADQLIPWQFVEEHAQDLAETRKVQQGLVQMENQSQREKLVSAVKKGETKSETEYKVELRRWDTPPHCSIARFDFEGYWAAVTDFYTNVLSRE